MAIAGRADKAKGLYPNSSVAIPTDTLIKAFKPLYTILIVTCIGSSMLVPLFIVLMFFSNRELRKKPIFVGNVLAISVGLSFGGVSLGMVMSILLNPMAPLNVPLHITFSALLDFGSILVDSVLLIRLWAIYPFRTTPRTVFFAIYVPIFLLKIARTTNAIIYLVNLTKRLHYGESRLWSLQQTWTDFPNYKIEWFLQVADNTATSGLFIAKLNQGRALRSGSGGRLGAMLNSLFWVAVYNFVIPIILSIVELIVIWTSTDIFHVIPIGIVNLYVEIIGVLLATVWAAGERWQDAQQKSTARSGTQDLTVADVVMCGVDISTKNSTP